jgi:hypothetical protein
MVLATLLLSLFLGSAVGDSSMSAPRTPDYWEAWGVVFVKATCDVDGRVLSAEVAQGTAAPAVLDSLVAVVKEATFDLGHIWDSRDLVQVVPFVTERHPRESERVGWIGLPEDLRSALARPPFDAWLHGTAATAAAFELDGFLCEGMGGLYAEPAPDYLTDPEMMEKRTQGLLVDSPDSSWVLDPYQGVYVEEDGTRSWDVDTGYTISERATGGRVFYDVVGPGYWSVSAAAWIDANRCLLVGFTHRDTVVADRVVFVSAPLIWEVNVATRTQEYYVGIPSGGLPD